MKLTRILVLMLCCAMLLTGSVFTFSAEETEAAPGEDKLIVAYMNVEANSIGSYEFTNIDVINYHPARVNSSYGASNPITHNFSSRLEYWRSIAREQNPDIKFLLTVANNNLNDFESWIINRPRAEEFAQVFLDIIETYDYDGFDIDYEFPQKGMERSGNFVHFMKTMRAGLDALGEKTGKEYYLSMAVPGTSWAFSLFDIEALSEHVDYFNLMNYDLYIGDNGGGTTHHHTSAYGNAESTGMQGGSVYRDILLYLEKGIPASKIVPGCGLYAIRWTNVWDDGDGLYVSGTRQGDNIHYTTLRYGYENMNGYKYYWDDEAKAPYLYNKEQGIFISYDDENSVKAKCELIAEYDVRGIMVFDYCTCDGVGLFDNMQKWIDDACEKFKPEEPPVSVTEHFTDLDREAWYMESVEYCVAKGFAKGVTDTTFCPDDTLSRAQFVTLLANLDGADLTKFTDADSGFTDVSMGQWFHDAVTWASTNEYVNGMGGGIFAPDSDVTREQMVKMLYNYATKNNMDTTASADLTSFTDIADLSEWASVPMKWAVAEGIINGTSATILSPQGTATRAQATKIFMKYDTLKNK